MTEKLSFALTCWQCYLTHDCPITHGVHYSVDYDAELLSPASVHTLADILYGIIENLLQGLPCLMVCASAEVMSPAFLNCSYFVKFDCCPLSFQITLSCAVLFSKFSPEAACS